MNALDPTRAASLSPVDHFPFRALWWPDGR